MSLRSMLKVFPFGLLFVFTASTTSAKDSKSFAAAAAAAAHPLFGCPVTLAWDPSADVDVTGYAIYYGVQNSAFTNRVDVGPAQTVTLTNLYANSDYFFFATAYNVLGIESVPSGVLFYSTPAITRLRLARPSDGSTVLRFRSAAGSPCRIEYSSNLRSNQWMTLAATNADAGGNVVVNDPAGGQTAIRFYRAVRP